MDKRTKENIGSFVRMHAGEDFDRLLSGRGYEYYYHLCSLRHALLSWVPFHSDWNALEVGASFGGMTGLYLKRFRKLDVLESDPDAAEALEQRFPEIGGNIFREGLLRYETEERYDVILVIDAEEFYLSDPEVYLNKAKTLLKKDGILVLGFRNSRGIKYACGALDEYVRMPFDTASLPDRFRVEQSAEGIFSFKKIFYPLPDPLYTQAVYSDSSMPEESIRDRVIPFDPFYSPLIRDERDEYDRLVQEGTLGEYCNFYLMFLTDRERLDLPIQAVLSNDRGERAYETVFYADDTVCKRAVSEEGRSYLERSFGYLEDLRSRGLKTVDQEYRDGAIRMPRVRNASSLSYLADRVRQNDRDAVLKFFDELWENILKSSESSSQGFDDKEWGLLPDEAGHILMKGYIDLIPYNCFRSDEGLIYYDQEFMVPDCPAAYIIYRAIHYTYLHLPKMQETVPQEEMMGRFGLTEKHCTAFQEREDWFVGENRNMQQFAPLYGWSYGITAERILSNRKKLIDWERDQTASRVHEIQLNLLRKFDAFCRQHDLHYFALHGTLLGAVRHKGFIPWDDDMDLGMKREDFDRLLQLYKNEKGKPFLQTMYNNGRIFFGGYARLRDRASAAMELYNIGRPGVKGVWIDILPLDYCEETREERAAHQKRISRIQRLIYAKLYDFRSGVIRDVDDGAWMRYRRLAGAVPFRLLYRALEREWRKVRTSRYRTIFACYYGDMENRNLYLEEELDALTLLPFEDTMIPVSKSYDSWLRSRFGENYMDLPPRRKRKHSNVLLDTEHSFEEYDKGEKHWD